MPALQQLVESDGIRYMQQGERAIPAQFAGFGVNGTQYQIYGSGLDQAEWQTRSGALDAGCEFAKPGWFHAWERSFLPYQNWSPPLRYVTARNGDGTLRAVFPFAIQTWCGISIASLAGFYWPYRAPIIPPDAQDETLQALVRAFTDSCTHLALRYGPLPDTHLGIEGFNAALRNRGWRVHCFKLGHTYSIDLPDTWSEFERSLGKNLRTNTYYYERKMRREGNLEIRCIRNAASAWPAILQDLAFVERQSWQHRTGGRPRFLGERNQLFWASVLSDIQIAGMASAWLIYFRGEPVSFCFCLDCGDTRHIIANCYAEHVKPYSTGSILYRHVLHDAIESDGIRHVNIGLGDSGYKMRWRAEPSFELVDWLAFRPGTRGYLLDLAQRMRTWLSPQRPGAAL